jgi:hypothetical protein
MKDIYVHPQYQTIFDNKRGDCFRACIATVTNIPIECVPNFCDQEVVENATEGYWWAWFQKWIGYLDCDAVFLNAKYVAENFNPGGVFVVGGQSPRFEDSKHAVVMCLTEDRTWKLVHDPHPDNTGIVGYPIDCTIIFPQDTVTAFFHRANASKLTRDLKKAYDLALPESLRTNTTSTNEQ